MLRDTHLPSLFSFRPRRLTARWCCHAVFAVVIAAAPTAALAQLPPQPPGKIMIGWWERHVKYDVNKTSGGYGTNWAWDGLLPHLFDWPSTMTETPAFETDEVTGGATSKSFTLSVQCNGPPKYGGEYAHYYGKSAGMVVTWQYHPMPGIPQTNLTDDHLCRVYGETGTIVGNVSIKGASPQLNGPNGPYYLYAGGWGKIDEMITYPKHSDDIILAAAVEPSEPGEAMEPTSDDDSDSIATWNDITLEARGIFPGADHLYTWISASNMETELFAWESVSSSADFTVTIATAGAPTVDKPASNPAQPSKWSYASGPGIIALWYDP